MSASLRRRLAKLAVVCDPGFVLLANGWTRVRRGLFVPPAVTAEEWERSTAKQQADALAGLRDPDQDAREAALTAELSALSKAADIAAQAQGKR